MNLNATLSKREIELVPYLISEKSKKQIADEICRSVLTVENHARNIYRKVGVTKGTGLCIWWFVQRFKIPMDQLPKSMTALFFLMLFLPYEFSSRQVVIRSSKCKEAEVIRVRNNRRNEGPATIEF